MKNKTHLGAPRSAIEGGLRSKMKWHAPLQLKEGQKMSTRNSIFGVARVILVDYEEFHVSLRLVSGTPDVYDRVAVPLTVPGAGSRHFLGAMPQVGDYCVVGLMPQESEFPKGTKTPIILSWIIPGVWTARDWETIAGFPVEELDLGNPKERGIVSGVFDRIRHKLRHAQPGNIIASSAQGADLVLDEGVTLASRRGNEFRLRDQDQAAIFRSLQQYHAMAGVRAYYGMVTRDANVLPASMFSDGKQWDGPVQSVDGLPLAEGGLPPSEETEGFLTPARVLSRGAQSAEKGFLGASPHKIDSHLDPYTFLKNGGFIDEAGYSIGKPRATAIYGGKPMFRVAQTGANTAKDPDAETLTEYRIELTHTSDGRLPVTEQTDLFDADRLPTSDPETRGGLKNRVFVESVMGSVVGNDPYTKHGKTQYGLPLVAKVFDGESVSPRLEAAIVSSDANNGVSPTPLNEHAATLFRIHPTDEVSPASFVSWNKKGQLKAFVSGDRKETSAEVAIAGGLKFAVGGKLQLSLDQGIAFKSARGDDQNNIGFELGSVNGAVRIFGGASKKGNEAAVDNANLPSVEIEAGSNMRLTAKRTLQTQARSTDMAGNAMSVRMGETFDLISGNRLNVSAQEVVESTTGKKTESFSGPKYGLLTSGALHEVVYAPTLPNVTALKTTFVQGSREESFKLGNHQTVLDVGDALYQTTLGSLTHKAGTNESKLTPSELKTLVKVGNMTLTASAGSAEFSGFTGVTVASDTGTATLRGRSVYLGAPIVGPDQGAIICEGSLDPFTGLPLATFGMGAKNHRVGV